MPTTYPRVGCTRGVTIRSIEIELVGCPFLEGGTQGTFSAAQVYGRGVKSALLCQPQHCVSPPCTTYPYWHPIPNHSDTHYTLPYPLVQIEREIDDVILCHRQRLHRSPGFLQFAVSYSVPPKRIDRTLRMNQFLPELCFVLHQAR